MPIVSEIRGDLIAQAKMARFEVIGHCCNCFCKQRKGIASSMATYFQTNDPKEYILEDDMFEGDIDKLGRIEGHIRKTDDTNKNVWVYNMYAQYHWKHPSPYAIPLDYDALRLCLRKLNYENKERTIGLPRIGAGLAGGDWTIIRQIIEEEMVDCEVTIVEFENPPF
jgi:O-acetyl-ADP-ribose deacetylase (regulator of RNase III)